jgi:integrase
MEKESLTDLQLKHLEPEEKRYEHVAGPPVGLYVVVHPTGRKTFMFRYRYRGRTRGLTFEKAYPDLTLKAARAEAKAAVKELDADRDPAVRVEQEKAAAPGTVKAVAEEWLRRAVQSTRTHGEVKRILDRDVLPNWKDRLITEIARPDVLRVLDAIVDRGSPVAANRTLSILKRFFRWTEERGYLENSPAAKLRPPSSESTRERVLAPDELAAIWAGAGALPYPWGQWFRWLILTGQRRGEVSLMKWAHVDKQRALWELPGEDTKSGRPHDVPLSAAALDILFAKDKRGNYLFPRFEGLHVWTTTSGAKPISGWSKAKAALDKIITAKRKGKALASWTVHDIRRTVATHLAKTGVPVHVVSALLNHTAGSTMGITAIYARHRYLDERRAALEAWGKYVEGLAVERKTA